MDRVKRPPYPPRSDGRRHCFGAHLSIAGGLHRAAAEALRGGFDTVQVFVKNQRQWRAAALDPRDVAQWRTLCATPGFGPPVAHASYLINLASPQRRLAERSRVAFAEELRRCDTLGIPYLVVHPGSATDGDIAGGLARVARALNRILAERRDGCAIPVLETTAGSGHTLGRTFTELAEIIAQLAEPSRAGVCVDTCHVFAAGYDVRRPEQYDGLVSEIERTVGVERVCCWHLNDSVGPRGSHRDRHAHIGHGRLGLRGFRYLLADDRFRGVPMILETPKGTDEHGRDWDLVNLTRLRRLAARARKPLPPHRRDGAERR
jgi:deoxyribonuclease-4